MSRVCLVTGGTSGIGEATVTALASAGNTVVFVGRSREKCDALAARLRVLPGAPPVHFLVGDLSLTSEVVRIAAEFERRFPRIDVLVNNAAGIFLRRGETAEGIEQTFALNYLAYFTLTTRLLPLLSASAPSRVVNVASSGHALAPGIRFDDLQMRRGYRGMKAYHHSKLAGIMFTYELARRLEGRGVDVNAVDPGMVRTGIGQNNGIAWRIAKPVVDRIMGLKYVPAEEGADTVIYLATSPEVIGTTGRFFRDRKAIDSSAASRDRAAAERLWRVSEEMTGKALSRVNAGP